MAVQATRLSIEQLHENAKTLRKHIIRMTTAAGSGHPSSSLSAVEVINALFFGGFLRYDADDPADPARDRFLLSKGHAVPVLYAAMAEAGYFSVDELMTLRKLGSPLEGHPNMKRMPGIEASTGSLGQGLSIGVGQALGLRMDGRDSRVFVMSGDGEMEEGQVWEAIASAEKYRLNRLTLIVDQNGYQQTGATKDVLDMTPFGDKITAFGWHTQTINGNDQQAVIQALEKAMDVDDRPGAIISQTQKGFGILSLLEETGDVNYHGKPLSAEMAENAIALIGAM